MYKVTTKSEWFLVPIGRPLKSNTEYTATEKRKFRGSYFDYWGYCINGTWYNTNIFKKIEEIKEMDNNKVRKDLIGREFKVATSSLTYKINKSEVRDYNISWKRPGATNTDSSEYGARIVNDYIDTGAWKLLEEWKLPEFWYVDMQKITTHQKREICNYGDKLYNGFWTRDFDTINENPYILIFGPSEYNSEAKLYLGFKPRGNMVEITFEQFKKYVLKEDVTTQETSTEVKSYTYTEIERIINKDFGKEDAEEILLSIKKIR